MKFIISLIYNILLGSMILIILSVASYVTFHFAGTVPDNLNERIIIQEIKNGNNSYLYLYKTDGYYVIEHTERQELINGVLSYYTTSEWNYLLWIIFVILTVITFFIIVMAFIEGDYEEIIDDAVRRSLLVSIKVTMESTIWNRLIGESDKTLRTDNILNTFDIRNIGDVKLCPKFETTSDMRNRKLKGII